MSAAVSSSRELVAQLERRFKQAERIAARDERADARAYVSDHLARQRAARVLDEQRAEREAIRRARADAHAQESRQSATDHALGKRADAERLLAEHRNALASSEQRAAAAALDALAGKRREQYRRALDYPMSAEELLAACVQALDDARLPDGDDRDETLGLLMAHVIGRHGTAPIRADIGRSWLRERAHRIHARECERRERATGLRASAAIAAKWAAEDESADAEQSGPDAIWRLAAGMPAPDPDDALDAEQACAMLNLTGKQADALTRALEVQQRVTAALSEAERKRAADARAAIRRTYPDPDSIRYALRPDRAREAAVDQAKLAERQRATVAGSGSHLPGSRLGASDQPARIALRIYGPRRATGSFGSGSVTRPESGEDARRAAGRRAREAARASAERIAQWQQAREASCGCRSCRAAAAPSST